MSGTLAVLLAGLLGLPAGWLARVAASCCRRREVGGRLPLLEAVMGLLWALVARRLWPSHPASLPAYLALAFLCVVLAITDWQTRLLPNRITYPAFPLVAVLLLAASLAEHHLDAMVRALAAAALSGLVFAALLLVSSGGMGAGDLKFAVTLGLALGWWDWGTTVAGLVAAFLLGGIAALIAMLTLGVDRTARLPFGPWLAVGALLALLTVPSCRP